MESAMHFVDGSPFGAVHGQVEVWRPACHIVMWRETGLGTVLPNPHVYLDDAN